MKLNCHHIFCKWCIDSWLKVNNQCPICREFVIKKRFCKDYDKFILKIIDLSPQDIKQSYILSKDYRKNNPVVIINHLNKCILNKMY